MKFDKIQVEIDWCKELEDITNQLLTLRKDGVARIKELQDKIKSIKKKKSYTKTQKAEKISGLKLEIVAAKNVASKNKSKEKELVKKGMKLLKKEFSVHSKQVRSAIIKTRKSILDNSQETKCQIITEYHNNIEELKKEKQEIYDRHSKSNSDKSTIESYRREISSLKERKKGIEIKRKRALKGCNRDKIEELLEVKKSQMTLRSRRDQYEVEIQGNLGFISNINNQMVDKTSSTSIEKTLKDRSFWISKVSIFSFLFLLILYIVLCLIGGIKIEYQKIFEGSSIIIAVALGGVFIYSMKGFDMSLGGATALAAATGGMVWNATHNIFYVLLIGILVGVGIELVNSTLANLLKLPVMVTTLAMSSVLGSLLTNILEGTPTQTIKVEGIRGFDTFIFYFGVIVAFFLICAFIFKLSPVGRRNKMIGANRVCSKYTGVNATKQGLITFIIAGVAIGVGGMLYVVRSRTVSINSCSTIGLDVILAVVFGGMQVTGGPKSKISAAILGGLTATLISYILIAIGRVTGFSNITQYESFVKGLLFLSIVAVNQIGNSTKRLPAIEMMW